MKSRFNVTRYRTIMIREKIVKKREVSISNPIIIAQLLSKVVELKHANDLLSFLFLYSLIKETRERSRLLFKISINVSVYLRITYRYIGLMASVPVCSFLPC